MKFTLKCEQSDYDNFTGEVIGVAKTVTHEFRGEELSEILENMESFLRGSGFVFDGNLDILEKIVIQNNDYGDYGNKENKFETVFHHPV